MTPRLCDLLHFTDGECRASMVTRSREADENGNVLLDLLVVYPEGYSDYKIFSPEGEVGDPNTWHLAEAHD